jgi:hypothetical protein
VHQVLAQFHEELAHQSRATMSGWATGAVLLIGCRRPMTHLAGSRFWTARATIAVPSGHVAAGAEGPVTFLSCGARPAAAGHPGTEMSAHSLAELARMGKGAPGVIAAEPF